MGNPHGAMVCTDHLGKEYPSKRALLDEYEIADVSLRYRLNKKGMSLEEALTTPSARSNRGGTEAVTDHLGKEYPSKAEMCAAYGIKRATFFRRLRCGWTLKDALETPMKQHLQHIQRYIIGPNGQKYTCIEQMCTEWGITREEYCTNIKLGLSMKDALTTHPEKTAFFGKTKCHDHLGKEYDSFSAMCKHYGVSKDTFRGRIELGWTLKEILTNPKRRTPSKPCYDHLGNYYERLSDMLEEYGVSNTTYNTRLKRGWTLEEALLGKGEHRNKNIGPDGTVYPSDFIMCRMNNLETATYYARVKRMKWPLERILYQFSTPSYNTFGEKLLIKKRLKDHYYEVVLNKHSCILSAQQIIDYYRNNVLWPSLGYKVLGFDDDGNAIIKRWHKKKTEIIDHQILSRDLTDKQYVRPVYKRQIRKRKTVGSHS